MYECYGIAQNDLQQERSYIVRKNALASAGQLVHCTQMTETRLKSRLKTFMAAHTVDGRKLTGTRFAAMLRTPYNTFEHWLRTHDKAPPACMLLVMDLLEQLPEARKLVGIDDKEAHK